MKEKLQTHEGSIDVLSKGGDGLQDAIPASGGAAVKGSPVVTKLKQLMEQVDTIKAERYLRVENLI